MILRPMGPAPAPRVVPAAWDAVEETQRRPAAEFWLITQPDHAALAGEIAARLGPPLLPALTAEVIAGIAIHDEGWAVVDAHVSLREGRPVSFLELSVADFVRAWSQSIARAEQVAPLAGAMVSSHFCRLGQVRADIFQDAPQDRRLLLDFLQSERARRRRLVDSDSRDAVRFLTDVLQFCDLLSLYLCCGAEQEVEFPQQFGHRPLRLIRETPGERAAVCRFDPSPFRHSFDVAVMARRYPGGSARQLPFVLI